MFGRIALVLVIFAAAIVATPASPVQVSYVYSDSMAPTIGKHDGYVVVPDTDIEVNDIIVFWSDEREEYVTHRVVGRSDEGLITQGDNNRITDQAAGHPHVRRADILGTVLTVRGDPVTIPGLGVLVSFVATNRPLVLGLTALLIGGGLVYNTGAYQSRPDRSLLRVSDVMHPLFAVALVAGVGFVLAGANSHELTYVALDGTVGGPSTLMVGESTTEALSISAPTVPFTHRMVTTEGMTITAQSVNASTVTAQVFIPGPIERGTYTTHIAVYRYPAVLPEQTVRTLQAIHPAVAASVTVGLLVAPIAVLYALVLDGQQPLRRSRRRSRTRPGGRDQ